jgi:hypothetical protein
MSKVSKSKSVSIKLPFVKGDKVFIIDEVLCDKLDCDVCEAKGKLKTSSGKEVDCRACLGVGFTENAFEFGVISGKVSDVLTTGDVSLYKDKELQLLYYVAIKGDEVARDEHEVFATEQAALKALKKDNDE